ncbi:MAG: GNAT family N-acetyltransferase [Clostridia bacterium]|nr:GNAT family N-acetyltransferase [Clostridia bacterium]
MICMITREDALAFPFSNDAEEITFRKMRQLLGAPDALCLSDGADLLFVRAGQGFPAWIYTRKGVSGETLSELAASLCVLKEAHNLAGVIGRASLVRYLELALPFPSARRLPLTAYLCEKPNRFSAEGERVPAKDLDPAVCGTLLAQLGEQAREPIPESARLAAGTDFCIGPEAYAWCINGTIVALTKVTMRSDGLSYINSVVTDADHRGRGYAKALVSSVCADAHERGERTMLYADTSYAPSNALYRAIGFNEAGRLIGFDFTM